MTWSELPGLAHSMASVARNLALHQQHIRPVVTQEDPQIEARQGMSPSAVEMERWMASSQPARLL